MRYIFLIMIILFTVSCAAEDKELIGNQLEAWADGRLFADSPYDEDEQGKQRVDVTVCVREGDCPEN